MGSMEDALRKAGLATAGGSSAAPSEPLPEKPCARCGKNFQPARPQHRMCDECAAALRAERAAGGGTRPEGAPGERPRREPRPPREDRGPREHAAPREERGPRPERAETGERSDRPPRRERPPHAGPVESRLAPRELPGGYLREGYFDQGGAVRRELLTSWAEQIAQGIAAMSSEATAMQLRLFANTVKRAQAAVKYGHKPVAQVLNEVEKMKAYAAERASRRKVPELFRRFVDANVERVNDEKTLGAFAQHFQAVEAFASGMLQTRKERR